MKQFAKKLLLPHALLAILVVVTVFVPNARATTRDCHAFLAAVSVMELLFLYAAVRGIVHKKSTDRWTFNASCGIICIVWLLLLAWELSTSVWNIAHPVLIPAPENVFDTFREHWRLLLLNVAYSMQLLLIGFTLGTVLALVLGLFTGCIPKIKAWAYPIANVLAPIPPIVVSPYLVALMPTFRSASVMVIVLGVFWPSFLNTVNRVSGIEQGIMDSARMLQPDTKTMVFRILLPYLMPGVVSGLKTSLTTALLMLNFAELMGATHGMGYYIQNSITYANYTHAVAGIITIGIVVTALNYLVTQIQKHLIKWQ